MRARNIKPGFFLNEHLAILDPLTRLLFLALWCIADRKGRLEDRPLRIKAELFPYDNCNIDEMLGRLQHSPGNFLTRYEVDGRKYIEIINFLKHQNPHIKEAPSVIPPPPLRLEVPDIKQVNALTIPASCKHRTCMVLAGLIPDSLIPDSLLLIPDSKTIALSDHKMILNDKSLFIVPVSKVEEWTTLFPSVDVPQQLRNMTAWCQANPGKRKTKRGIEKFIVSWLSKDQDRGNGSISGRKSMHAQETRERNYQAARDFCNE